MKRMLLVAVILVSSLFSYGVASGSSTGTLYPLRDNVVVWDTMDLRAENRVYENSEPTSTSGSILTAGISAHWDMYFTSKLSVRGKGRAGHDSTVSYGWCETNVNGTFLLYDEGVNRSYTGTYSIAPDGKTIQFTLDSNGLAEMADMLTDWITEMGASAGLLVEVQDLSGYVTISNAKLQKKTNAPSKVTVKVTGTVTALVNGIPGTANFTYKSTVKHY